MSVLLVAPVALVLLASDAQATALFADGFATNPDTSGQWTIYRKTPDTANEASWDAGAGTLYLTRPVGDRATAIFANHALTEHSWNATFKYRTGGGGSALINPLLTGTPLAGALGGGADGFVFLFYKSQQPYASSPPAPGAALGFTTAGGAVPGYGIAFNEWNGNTVRLIKDSADNTLATTTDARVGDDAWHTAMVRFSDGRVKVGIDGGIILDTVLPTVNYTFSGVGFSAATGGNTNNHAIDDFQLSAEAPLASKLLSPRAHASAVWTGTRAFVFGGTTDGSTMLDGIERYDPVTDVSTLMAAKLPTPRTATSAVWTGTHAYIFGGVVSSCYCQTKQILRYDPATDTVTTMAAQLPDAVEMTSAVWTGTYAYIFGGLPASNKIVRYDPVADVTATMAVTLPQALYGTSAAWDGTKAYVFGGRDGSLHDHDTIFSYDPVAGTVATLSATLPTARSHTSAVWSGTDAYLFGGHDGTAERGEIVRYDPLGNSATTMGQALPTGRHLTAAVWDGAKAHVFGGYGDSGYLDEIAHYAP